LPGHVKTRVSMKEHPVNTYKGLCLYTYTPGLKLTLATLPMAGDVTDISYWL